MADSSPLTTGQQAERIADLLESAATWIDGNPLLDYDGDPEGLLCKTWNVVKLRESAAALRREEVRAADEKTDVASLPPNGAAEPFEQRVRRFNDSVGALSWGGRPASEHPDACVCNSEPDAFPGTPHKHYLEAPFACGRCKCRAYHPALSPPAVSVEQARGSYDIAQRTLYEKRSHRQNYTDAEIVNSVALVELCWNALIAAAFSAGSADAQQEIERLKAHLEAAMHNWKIAIEDNANAEAALATLKAEQPIILPAVCEHCGGPLTCDPMMREALAGKKHLSAQLLDRAELAEFQLAEAQQQIATLTGRQELK